MLTYQSSHKDAESFSDSHNVWWVKISFSTVQKLFSQSSRRSSTYHRQFGERKLSGERLVRTCISTSGLNQCSRHFDFDLEWNKIKMHLCNPKCFCNKDIRISLRTQRYILGNVLLWMLVWLQMQQIPKILLPSTGLNIALPPKNADKCHLSCGRPTVQQTVKLRLSIQPEKKSWKASENDEIFPKIFRCLIVFQFPDCNPTKEICLTLCLFGFEMSQFWKQ